MNNIKEKDINKINELLVIDRKITEAAQKEVDLINDSRSIEDIEFLAEKI